MRRKAAHPLLLDLHDLGVDGVLAHGLDAVEAALLGGVALGRSDVLAVLGEQAEAELAGLVDVDLELGARLLLEALDGLILDVGLGRIVLDGG